MEKIELTGAIVETLKHDKHYVIFNDKIVGCYAKKHEALSVAYQKKLLENLSKPQAVTGFEYFDID